MSRVPGVSGRSRVAVRALLLAAVLTAGASLLPAAAPTTPLLAGLPGLSGLAQRALAAPDELDVQTTARYVVDPATHRVRVTVDLTALNRKPPVTGGGTVTRYFFDGVNLGIQPEAVHLRATQDGQPVHVKVVNRDGYRLATLRFRDRIYFQETARVRLLFDLPAGEPRSDSDVRVGSAFATFVAWAFGDAGTVRVEVPSRYRVDHSGAELAPAPGTGDTVQALTGSTDDPLDWYAQVNATDDGALTNDRLTLDDGEPVVIHAWPEDARWRSRVRTLLRDGVPELARRIGLPWPVDGPLSVVEVHTPILEGYAGFYDQASDEITISEDLDDLTIVHEASHAWFNKRLFTERWIGEGLADEYASQVLTALGRKADKPGSVKRGATAAFPLEAWPPPAPIRDTAQDARERYGYDASWTAMRQIVRLVGEDGMRRLFAAAEAGTTAYPGEGTPEKTALPNDWRRFLDLADELGAKDGVDAVVQRWALAPKEAGLLPPRAAARAAYATLAEDGGAWAPPDSVRTAMDAWRFGAATDAMAAATTVLERRDELASLAGAQGLVPPPDAETRYQDAGTEGELAVLAGDLGTRLDALQAIDAAAGVVAAPRDWLVGLGLDGADPDAALAAARTAWEAGDADAARSGAEAAVATLAAAPAAGRSRATTIGGAVVGGAVARAPGRRPAGRQAASSSRARGRGGGCAVRYTPGPRRPGRAHGRPGARRRRSPESVTDATAVVPGPR